MANNVSYSAFGDKLRNSISRTLSLSNQGWQTNSNVTVPKCEQMDKELGPEIGFKLVYNQGDNELQLILIGARNLPVSIGLNSIQSYLIKVTLFPDKDKKEFHFESTDISARLIRNESVTFKNKLLTTGNKFVVIAIHAVLNTSSFSKFLATPPSEANNIPKKLLNLFKRSNSDTSANNKVDSGNTSGFKRNGSLRRSSRVSIENSRNIGTVTYTIETKAFVQNADGKKCLATFDIWRPLHVLSSGLKDFKGTDEKNGSVEVTVKYSVSEDGKNNMVCMALNRIHFNKTLIQEFEELKGRLYVKLMIFNDSINDETKKRIAKWKSKQFDPTICMKFEPFTAIVQAFFEQISYHKIRLEIQLLLRNMFGKKTVLANVGIEPQTPIWNEIFYMPSTPVTKWLNLRKM